MFGAVFLLGVVICSIIALVRNTKEDYHNRTDYRHDQSNTYLAHDMVYRDLDTGKARFLHKENGDLIMRGEDIEPVNLSQIERDKEYEKLKNKTNLSRTTCFFEPDPKVAKYGTMRGNRYKDLETGEIYVVRRFQRRSFYVGLADRKVKRYTDSQKRSSSNMDEEKDIVNFQKEIDEAKNDQFWKNTDYTMVGCPNSNINGLIDTWEN